MSPRPASSQVSTARPSGLVITRVKFHSVRALGNQPASSRPLSVNGMSVRPVWRMSRLHSVSPCRTRTICIVRILP